MEPSEKETIILFNEEDDFCTVYTHNTRIKTCLDNLCKTYPDSYSEIACIDKVCKTYQFNKNYMSITFKKGKKK